MPETIKKRRNFYLIGAILGVVFLFSYYFLAYIPQREDGMNARGIRVMNRMINNIGEREEHYQKSMALFECDYEVSQILAIQDEETLINAALSSKCFWAKSNLSKNDSTALIKASTVSANNQIEFLGNKVIPKIRIKSVLKSIQLKIIRSIEKELKLDARISLSPLADTSDYIIYHGIGQVGAKKLNFLESAKEKNNAKILGINAVDFLKEVKRYQYFEDIVLTNPVTDEVIDSSKLNLRYFSYQPQSKLVKTEEVIPDGKDDANDHLAFDTNKKMYRIASVDIVEREISNKSYYSFTSVVKIDGKDYYLTGLISDDKYNGEVRAVSIWVVMISIVFLIFLMLALPVAKPFILSKKERLQGLDITGAYIGLVFGMAAFALFIVGIHSFGVKEIDLIDQKLNLYAKNLSGEFDKELYEKVELLESMSKSNDINKDSTLTGLSHFQYEETTRFLRINEKGSAYYFKLMPADDSSESINVIELSEALDLSHRNYFKVYKKNDNRGVWNFESNEKGHDYHEYFVESIFSLSTGKHETVVAIKPQKGFPLFASVSEFKSVNNVFLEPNFSFCILDSKGVIHYHSDQAKIHNEDFLQEASNDDKLKGYLKNNSTSNLSINYSLNDYRARINPIKNTPWHLVTFYDIKKSRLTVTSSMAITFEVLFALFLYMMALHLMFKVLHRRKVRKGQPSYPYMFLNPITNSDKNYWWLATVNAGIILFLYAFYRYNHLDILLNLCMYFAAISFAVLFNYSILSQSFNNLEDGQEVMPRVGSRAFEFVLLALILVWIISTVFLIGRKEGLGFPFALLLGIGLYIYHAWGPGKIVQSKVDDDPNRNYSSFYAHAFSWVFLLSVVPALLFFKPAFNQQNIKRTLNNLQDEVNQLHLRGENQNTKKIDIYAGNTSNIVTYGSLEQNLISRKFVELISPYFNEDGSALKGQYAKDSLKLEILFKHEKNEFSSFFEVKTALKNAFSKSVELNPSTTAAFDLPNVFADSNKLYAILFWLIILGAALGLLEVIKQLGNKFFYLNILKNVNALEPKDCQIDLSDVALITKTEGLKQEQQNIMLVGPPYSGRNAFAKSLIKDDGRIRYIDFLNNIELEIKKVKPDAGTEKVDKKSKAFLDAPIIINNFDYRIFDFDHNIEKLKLLEEVIRYRNENQISEKLLIVSSFSTSQLVDIYAEKIAELESGAGEEAEKLKNTMYRWESILHGFSKQIVPLTHIPSKNLVENELSVGNALVLLKPQVLAYQEKLNRTGEQLTKAEKDSRIISYIVDAAQNYYFAMWNTCSKEEKFLLFDLAQDGLVNTKNEKVIYELVRKGILEANPTLRIFNQSFAEFIVNAISEEEGTQMEREAKKEGVWNTYKFVAIFVVLIIVVFLSFVEKQAFTKITGVVSLGAMLLPNIIKVFNSIGSSSKFFGRS